MAKSNSGRKRFIWLTHSDPSPSLREVRAVSQAESRDRSPQGVLLTGMFPKAPSVCFPGSPWWAPPHQPAFKKMLPQTCLQANLGEGIFSIVVSSSRMTPADQGRLTCNLIATNLAAIPSIFLCACAFVCTWEVPACPSPAEPVSPPPTSRSLGVCQPVSLVSFAWMVGCYLLDSGQRNSGHPNEESDIPALHLVTINCQ